MKRLRTPDAGERGASVVEMALLTPFLVLLLFGIIEFGWAFAQNLDVKHGAREAARMISIDENPGGGGTQAENIISDVCGRMDLHPGTSVTLSRSGSAVDSAAEATVTVAVGQNTLTGFLDWAIPPTMTISANVKTRLQKEAHWANDSGTCP